MKVLKLGLSAIGIAGCVILLFLYSDNFSSALGPKLASVPNSVGLPVYIKIPAIHVDAAIEKVGLTPGGEMDVPKIPTNTAWFNLGPRPGEKGNAVIAGHFGWKNGTSGAFDNLHTLRKGDKIYIEDENGMTTIFVIRESRSYDPSANALEVFSSNDEKAHLNLITCEGVWNNAKKSYSNRLVLFADKESTPASHS